MRKIMLLTITIAAMYIIGCGGATVLDAPAMTGVVMDDNSVTVMWEADTSIEDHADFSGYNVYVHTDSAALMVEDGEDLDKDNATPITDNSYEVTGLDQDTVYYFQVRTVNIDDAVGDYNETTPYMQGSPRPEFTVMLKLELSGANQNEDSCAIRFETAEVLSESLDVFPNADVFFERFSDTLQVNSASRRTATGFTPRTTLMYNYGQEEFDDFYEFDESDIDKDHQVFVIGDLIVFQTEEGNYVKLHVDDYDDVNATIDIIYAYQNIADYPYFSPGH
jgi:hypothetical protein